MKSVKFNDLSKASQIFAESFVEKEPEDIVKKNIKLNEDLNQEDYFDYTHTLSSQIKYASRQYLGDGLSLQDVLRALEDIAIHYEDLGDVDELFEAYSADSKRVNESVVVEAICKLLEASMSDEDKRDSEIIRNLYKKIDGKQYKKFTPEEQEIIDKYGLDAWGFRGDTAIVTSGKNDIVKRGDLSNTSWDGRRSIPNKNADKINFADRARKTDSRDWGRKYANYYKNPNIREREAQAWDMKRPYDELKSAKSRYNYSKSKLDDYYNDLAKQIEKADTKYTQDTNNAILTKQREIKSSSSSIKNAQTIIDDILNKHRKAVKEALRQLSLKEAMSDEDRKDSQILRDILSKINKRSNARLTPEENAVLDKYNIERLTRGLSGPNATIGLDYYQDTRNLKNPEYNLAGKFRTGGREYANSVKQYKGWHDTFQDAERAKENDVMGKDVSSMKFALASRRSWVNNKDKAEQDYNKAMETAKSNRADKIAQLTDPERYKGYRDQAEKDKAALNNVRRKYGFKTEESLKEGWGDDFDRKIDFYGDKVESILDSIQGQMSDGIWENTPSMEAYWQNFKPKGDAIFVPTSSWSRDSRLRNPYAEMDDWEIRKYFANKAKYIAQLWMHDNRINPYKGWRPDNMEECDYMHDGITIADMFKFFKENK